MVIRHPRGPVMSDYRDSTVLTIIVDPCLEKKTIINSTFCKMSYLKYFDCYIDYDKGVNIKIRSFQNKWGTIARSLRNTTKKETNKIL